MSLKHCFYLKLITYKQIYALLIIININNMKLIITKENLIKALQKVIGVVEKRQSMPILSHILLKKDNEGFHVVASDLEVQLSSKINFEETIDFAGDITIPGRKLFDIGKGLPDKALIEIEKKDEGKLQIESKKSKFTLSALDAKTFPVMENNDENSVEFSLDSSDLKDVFSKTAFAMAQQDVRYYLNGLFMKISDKELYGVATDGHRLAKAGSSIKASIEDEVSIIIPRKGVLEIDKQIEEKKELKITASKNHMQVDSGDAMAITKLIDGKFPDYEKVIPKDADKLILVDCKIFKDALTRVSILSNDRFRGVRLHFENGEIKVSANNPEKDEASDDIKAEYSGDSMEVGFNVNYLLDVIGAIRTKNLQIQLKDSNSSALLTPENDPDSSYVVMPLRL